MSRSLSYCDERLLSLRWNAAAAFAEHQLTSETYWHDGAGAQWTIQRPGTYVYLAQVISGAGGSLIVHGDINLSRFGHYSDHRDAYSRLLWMARSQQVDGYVWEKATIGLNRQSTHTYDPEAAVAMLEDRIADTRRDVDDGEPDREGLVAIYREALDYTDDEHRLRQFLYENDGGWNLWEHDWTVIDADVVYAHAALQRTMWLLIERYGTEGPPACRSGS